MMGHGLRNLSDEDLLARLDELVRQEKQLGANIVAHLVEVERRGLHLEYGYSSIFKYCVEKLGLSEDLAYKRMQAVRAVEQCPEILDHLASRGCYLKIFPAQSSYEELATWLRLQVVARLE